MTLPVDIKTDPRTYSIDQLRVESGRLEALIGPLERQLQDARRGLNAVRSELERRLRPSVSPRVSDRAVVQYLNLVLGFDVEAVRELMLTDGVKSAMRAGALTVPIEGARLRLDGNVVVTVIDDTLPKKSVKKLRTWERPERQSARDAIREGLEEDADDDLPGVTQDMAP